MTDTEKFYNSYRLGVELKPGDEIKLRHHITFDSTKANLAPLVALSAEALTGMKQSSEEKEKQIFEKLYATIEEWEQQAAQTLILGKAIEYVRTAPVKHTANKWVRTEYGSTEISNMVYKMSYRIQEETKYDRKLGRSAPCGWTVSWSVMFNDPPSRGYSGRQIASQDKKRYTEKADAEKYVRGRIEAYAELFTELSPPIPEDKKHLFSVNGHLLPGYSLQPHAPTSAELLSFVTDEDISATSPPTPPEPEHTPAEANKSARQKKRDDIVR